jgi:hypothetical protein
VQWASETIPFRCIFCSQNIRRANLPVLLHNTSYDTAFQLADKKYANATRVVSAVNGGDEESRNTKAAFNIVSGIEYAFKRNPNC